MRGKLKHLPKPVARTILAFYRRKRIYELLRALVVPLLCYAVLALFATHLDRFLFLETAERLWISGVTCGLTLLMGAVSLGAFVWRNFSVSRLAYEMERMLPKATAERLVTLDDILAREAAVPAADGSVHAALVEQLTSETVALCERTPHTARLARDRLLKRRAFALGLLALVWAGLFAVPSYQFSLMLQRLTFPLRNLPKPSFMRLTVTADPPVIGRGGEVVLQVRVDGQIPPLLQRPMRWMGTDASLCQLATATGRVERLPITAEARPMSRVQRSLFVASRNDLQESFSYRVRCGDAQTDIRLVRVVAQPRATGVSVQVEPPAYTGLKTMQFEDLRDPVPAFAGSRVQLRFAADQSPLKTARLIRLGDGNTIAELKPDPKTGIYLHAFEMAVPIDMEIVLVNELGFENVERVRLSMVLREDQAPNVRLEYPAGELTAVQGELVPMHMELTDDLGLLEGAICYQINPGRKEEAPIREIPLAVEEKRLSQPLSTSFDLAKTDAVPGDDMLLWVRVRDTGRSDERSQSVRIRITAFAGNENERRRVAALRFVAQALATVEPSAADHTVLALNESAYEPIAAAANAQGFALSSRAVPESLLEFIEFEHHFTDGAAAAEEVRLLYGMISAMLYLPPTPSPNSVEARKDDLRRFVADTVPALLRERMARDLIRRALNLRGEARATVGGAATQDRQHRASYERRVDLLLEALDNTGADLATLARMSPQLLKLDDLLAFTRQISRTSRDLKHADTARQQDAGKTLCEQIDGWIGLLLAPLPEWKTQRLAARATLRSQYSQRRDDILKSTRTVSRVSSAEAARWMVADARMIERSPFLGLAERLAAAVPGAAGTSNSLTNVAVASEAGLLKRAALDAEFADWLSSASVTPSERRVAAAFKALDLADSAAAYTAVAGQLRTLNIDDDFAAGAEVDPTPPAFFGLYAQLTVLTDAATALAEPHDKALEDLAGRTSQLLVGLTGMAPPPEGGAMPNIAPAIATLETGLIQWESDALRLSYRIHLDLAYGDPHREHSDRLAAALSGLRAALSRYQAFVPPLLSRLKASVRKSSKAENIAAATSELEDLTRSVNALSTGLKRTAKQLRGEEPSGEQSEAVREIRLYYTAARDLAKSDNPAAVVETFFAKHPSAAAIVLESQMPAMRDLRNRIKEAGDVLHAETATNAVFVNAMQQAVQLTGDFQQRLARFAALDADGAVRALATDIRKRSEALIRPGRDVNISRDKLALDELRRLVEQFENQARELILRCPPSATAGWRGGPAGLWDGNARRDAEHARLRMIAQFERARRDTALGFDAMLTNRDKSGAALPDAPLANALFAWRTLHSSLGGETLARRREGGGGTPNEKLLEWLMRELDETSKAMRRSDGAVRLYQAPTVRLVDSLKGFFRY